MRHIIRFYNSFLCHKYKKEAAKIKKFIQNFEKEHSTQIDDDGFLREMLNSKKRFMKVAAAYFFVKKFTGKSLYDVQIMALLAMYDGFFVDVKTGEGKTIIIGAYCLIAEKPIHVVTVNDYLAEEAIRQLGEMYAACNMSFGIIKSDNFMNPIDMKKDVIYGTASAFAFKYIVKRFQRDIDYELYTAVIDEADYVLIDNATSSFTVSVSTERVDDEVYETQRRLTEFVDRINKIFEDANVVHLNYDEVLEWSNLENDLNNTIFVNKALKFIDFSQDIQDYVLSISKEYRLDPAEAISFMYGIVFAYHIYEKNVDYIVQDNKVILVDKHNGRLLPNSRHDFYLNLALTLKEDSFEVDKSKNIGKIANQVYFLKYENVIGLSGSLVPVEKEISEIFKTNVVEIPKNKASKINKKYYLVEDKDAQLLSIVKDNVDKGKATLVICKSDKEASRVSNYLQENGFENTLFNNTTELISEDKVIRDAGKNKKITVSTLLFGRGTDIIPNDDSVILSIIMYEEFGSERAEVQVSGRTGRQGRNGDVHILVSPHDEIFQYVNCKTQANLNEKNFMRAIKNAISNIYSREKTTRDISTYFAYYIDMIYEYYYKEIKSSEYDDYFLSKMEDIEQISLNLDDKKKTSKLIMDEAKKVIDSIAYYNKEQ